MCLWVWCFMLLWLLLSCALVDFVLVVFVGLVVYYDDCLVFGFL